MAPQWVLASYSCIIGQTEFVNARKDEVKWTLYAGSSSFDENNLQEPNTQQIDIAQIYTYPQVNRYLTRPLRNMLIKISLFQAKYKHFQYSGDAVLLELQRPLVFGPNVASACLSDTAIDQAQSCMAAGWGVSKPGGTQQIITNNFRTEFVLKCMFFNSEQSKYQQQQYLSYLSVPTISIDQCNSTSHYSGSLSDDAICSDHATSSGTTCYVNRLFSTRYLFKNIYMIFIQLINHINLLSICKQNDEGAPLMCFDEKKSSWNLHGILSYHGNCGRRPQPTIYSAMSKQLLHWIAKTVGNEFMISK